MAVKEYQFVMNGTIRTMPSRNGLYRMGLSSSGAVFKWLDGAFPEGTYYIRS